MKKYILFIMVFLLNSCYTMTRGDVDYNDISMCPIPADTPETLKNISRAKISEKTYYPLGIIGEVEPTYLKDMKSVFPARIDTGAETSSIDVTNIKEFERDGDSWVSFDIENRETKEKKMFEKKITRKTNIKRQKGGDEIRITVNMEIKIGNQYFVKEFTLANREKFNYQVLIGRNILNGLAIVDVGIKNSLN